MGGGLVGRVNSRQRKAKSACADSSACPPGWFILVRLVDDSIRMLCTASEWAPRPSRSVFPHFLSNLPPPPSFLRNLFLTFRFRQKVKSRSLRDDGGAGFIQVHPSIGLVIWDARLRCEWSSFGGLV